MTPPYPQKLALNFINKWLSVGIVRLWTKGHGVCLDETVIHKLNLYLYFQHPDASVEIAADVNENEKTEAETSTPDTAESLCDPEVNVPTSNVTVSIQEFKDKTEDREKQAEQEVKSRLLTENEEEVEEEEEENEEDEEEQEEEEDEEKRMKKGEEEKKGGKEEEKLSEPDGNRPECGPVREVEPSSPKPDHPEGNKPESMGGCSDVGGSGRELETDEKVSYF
jgi:hypothetical protein